MQGMRRAVLATGPPAIRRPLSGPARSRRDSLGLGPRDDARCGCVRCVPGWTPCGCSPLISTRESRKKRGRAPWRTLRTFVKGPALATRSTASNCETTCRSCWSTTRHPSPRTSPAARSWYARNRPARVRRGVPLDTFLRLRGAAMGNRLASAGEPGPSSSACSQTS